GRAVVWGKAVVRDPFRPDGDGTYQPEGGPSEACARIAGTGPDPDLTLEVNALGAAYLGGVSFATLAAAGRMTGG
ncbi:MAG: sterol carrier protein domain-containing protein, partial [Acidimicrobiia bacterium]